MAIRYDARSGAFRDASGRFVSHSRAMRSSTARASFEAAILADFERKIAAEERREAQLEALREEVADQRLTIGRQQLRIERMEREQEQVASIRRFFRYDEPDEEDEDYEEPPEFEFFPDDWQEDDVDYYELLEEFGELDDEDTDS